MKRVIIIGDLFLDILPSALPVDKKIVLNDGETFIDSVTFQRGGCAGNFAAVMVSLMPQDEITFVTKVGSDQNGIFLKEQLESYGMKTSITKSNLGTAITIAVSYNDGERHFITYNGAMDDFAVDDIDSSLFDNADHLVWRGIWFTPKLLHNSHKFLKIAKDKGLGISMDLGFDPFWANPDLGDIVQRKKSALDSLQYVDYLFGNSQEICNLTDSESLDKGIPKLFEKGVNHIIVHMGAKGAMIYDSVSEKSHVEAFPVTSRKNPVGTGDTHDAAFVYKILNGDSSVDAAKYATQAAAYSLSNPAGTKITIESVLDYVKNMISKQ